MVNSIAKIYDQSLTEVFNMAGYTRSALGMYTRSDDNIIWRGLWVTFNLKQIRVATSPNLGIFCPAASKVAEEGLSQIYGPAVKNRISKLGWPLITYLLYERVHLLCGEDRQPFSYDVMSESQVEKSVQLIYRDFTNVAADCFAGISSISELRDKIVAHPSGTGASVYAMALTYLTAENITCQEIDN